MKPVYKIALGVGALIVAGACGAGAKSGTGSSGSNDSKAAATVGQAANDGKFQFTVSKVECGIAHLGDTTFGKDAQGQFCKVSVNVKNIGNEAKMFDASSQHAFNAAGQKYDADGTASIYLGDLGHAFLENINPGNAVDGVFVFDIPKDQKINKLELHDSPFSGGVTVTVG
jgi:hypothetical protein